VSMTKDKVYRKDQCIGMWDLPDELLKKKFNLMLHEYFYQSYILSYGPKDIPAHILKDQHRYRHSIRSCVSNY
jgi:hypothetical protein